MEIERKYIIDCLPADLEKYPFHRIEQAYLCTCPVIRIRRQDDCYILTYKSEGLMAREEYNLPLTAEAYAHLKPKADGIVISKTRYLIPYCPGQDNPPSADTHGNPRKQNLIIELDVFDKPYEGVVIAEVEFASIDEANSFVPPDWFGEDVTMSTKYHNSTMSQGWK